MPVVFVVVDMNYETRDFGFDRTMEDGAEDRNSNTGVKLISKLIDFLYAPISKLLISWAGNPVSVHESIFYSHVIQLNLLLYQMVHYD